MTRIALALLMLAGCGKKSPSNDQPAARAGSGSSAAPAPAAATPEPPPGNGLAVTDHETPEFSGRYDKVFAQLRHDEHKTVVAFVRDCPELTCETGAWVPEDVAHVCPKAFIATLTIDGEQPVTQRTTVLALAGPAEHAATATIAEVVVDLTAVGNDGVSGTAAVENRDAAVRGSFHAEVCPLQ
ncbi:MAG TPA: hypothetical protein VLX92_16895 [Kofleriaceae bacterium]|nr:hypothetical protein [Kofleriaceae bacterium]